MGIKHYFKWFKTKFSNSIYHIKKGQTISKIKEDGIDNLMIDMNGLFHNSTQKIYQYGNFKPPQRLMGVSTPQKFDGLKTQMKVFQDICLSIENIVNTIKPNKRIIMCIDGVAPFSKQAQQRSRRFMASLDTDPDKNFNSSNITPGTKFMYHLNKYIDWYIRKEKSNPNSHWNKLEVVYSNSSAPGEGEFKLMSYIRKYGNKSESYCINGMDADLIMLALASHIPKFYVLREEMMSSSFDFYFINIGTVRESLSEIMRWNDDKHNHENKYNMERSINDFVFLCFSVGNDFIPHIPALEITEGGIEMIFNVYKTVGEEFGHITKICPKNGVQFCKKSLSVFMYHISLYEKKILEDKLAHKDRYFPDKILEESSSIIDGKYTLNIEEYRSKYYTTNLPECKDEEKLCHDYLEGMQWVLSYYTRGVPNWKWRFPYHYGPFAHTLCKHVNSFTFPSYPVNVPALPFIQLLCILPPKSADLLPEQLTKLLQGEEMAKYCPSEFQIDTSGCKNSWEAKVILPFVDVIDVEKLYMKNCDKISEIDMRRNFLGKSYVYQNCRLYTFNSFYGNINCSVKNIHIDL
jgi:5'-3' exonuclease